MIGNMGSGKSCLLNALTKYLLVGKENFDTSFVSDSATKGLDVKILNFRFSQNLKGGFIDTRGFD